MGSKAPQPPPPEYQRGDIVIAADDIYKRRDDGSMQRLFLKGDRLRIVSVSEFYSTMTVHGDDEPSWRTFPVLASEITKPPRPTSPPPPRKP